MNLLREYVRMLLTEAAKSPADLPQNVTVVIQTAVWAGTGGVQIHYGDPEGKYTIDYPEGSVYIVPTGREDTGPCSGAWKVSRAEADKGWGPMLYDVAMEWATLNAGGLIADRDAVSPEARRVWDYYLSGRSDVTAHQLDDLKNTLTPEDEDNCAQRVAGFDVTRPAGGKYSPREKTRVEWVNSPLSKRYTKEPTVINTLRAAGRLIER